MTNYAPTTITTKPWLSRQAFELICGEAANSTSCGDYISNVMAGLCRWLKDHGCSAEPPNPIMGSGNTQVLVILLYQLLEERCKLDFDVTAVLNAHAPPYHTEELL